VADLHSLRRATQAIRVARILRDYDLMYSHTSIPGEILGEIAARVARTRHLVHRHTPAHVSPSFPVRTVQTTLYRTLLRTTPVIAVSAQVRSSVLRMGLTPARVRVVPNGAPGGIEPTPVRSEGPLTIGVLGRIDPQKGMDVFLEARARLPQQGPHRFVIAGIGGAFPDFERSVRQRAAGLGVAIEDGAGRGLDFLRALDIVALPSRWEGSPLTLFEAMALGKPIVASDIPGISEVLGPRDAGLLVPTEDVGAMANAITTLMSDVAMRQRLGHAARAASAAYSEAAMIGAVVAEIEKLVPPTPGEGPT
jgi:glycosyltransferase involved in cell wall biosynthesis